VDIDFSTHRLARAGLSSLEADRLFGTPIGRKYIQRLAILRASDRFSDLFEHRALRLHPLKGDRAGQFSISLTGNYRLIVERVAEDRVRVVDVEDYHGN